MAEWFLFSLQAFHPPDGGLIKLEWKFETHPREGQPVTLPQAQQHVEMVALPSLPEAWLIVEWTVQPAPPRLVRPWNPYPE